MGDVRDGRKQRRIDKRGAEAEQSHRQQADAEPAAQYDEQNPDRLSPHPYHNHALASDPV